MRNVFIHSAFVFFIAKTYAAYCVVATYFYIVAYDRAGFKHGMMIDDRPLSYLHVFFYYDIVAYKNRVPVYYRVAAHYGRGTDISLLWQIGIEEGLNYF